LASMRKVLSIRLFDIAKENMPEMMATKSMKYMKTLSHNIPTIHKSFITHPITLSVILIFSMIIFLLLSISATTPVIAAAEHGQGKIAFVANLEGNWDIFIHDLATHKTEKITTTPYDEENPAWSPDGRFLVYTASDGLLHMVNLESKEQTSLTFSNWEGKFVNPAWSPDGEKIAAAYFKSKKTDDTDLVLIDIKKKETRKKDISHKGVTFLLEQHSTQFFPSWSPDGAKIAYVTVHCSLECGHIIQEVWLANAVGHSAHQLLLTNAMCMQPVWAPDGQRIAFSADMKGNFDIWVYNLQSKELKAVTDDRNLDIHPSWSPDGKKIAFISTRSGQMAVWISDLETGKLAKLVPFEQRDIECKDAAWH